MLGKLSGKRTDHDIWPGLDNPVSCIVPGNKKFGQREFHWEYLWGIKLFQAAINHCIKRLGWFGVIVFRLFFSPTRPIWMAWCKKTVVSPLPMHRRYCCLKLSHWYYIHDILDHWLGFLFVVFFSFSASSSFYLISLWCICYPLIQFVLL